MSPLPPPLLDTLPDPQHLCLLSQNQNRPLHPLMVPLNHQIRKMPGLPQPYFPLEIIDRQKDWLQDEAVHPHLLALQNPP